MAFTYSKLAEVTVGAGGVATITFNNIPQNYNDLVLKVSLRSSNDTMGFNLNINGSSSSFTAKWIEGTGAAVSSYNSNNNMGGYANRNSTTASTFSSFEVYLPEYTSSNFKSQSIEGVTENNATTAFTALAARLWSNVTAISQLSIAHPDSGQTYVQHSTATLYGVKAEV